MGILSFLSFKLSRYNIFALLEAILGFSGNVTEIEHM